jgi:hypothetical protein
VALGEADAIEEYRVSAVRLQLFAIIDHCVRRRGIGRRGREGRNLPLSEPICVAIGTITPSCSISISRQPPPG